MYVIFLDMQEICIWFCNVTPLVAVSFQCHICQTSPQVSPKAFARCRLSLRLSLSCAASTRRSMKPMVARTASAMSAWTTSCFWDSIKLANFPTSDGGQLCQAFETSNRSWILLYPIGPALRSWSCSIFGCFANSPALYCTWWLWQWTSRLLPHRIYSRLDSQVHMLWQRQGYRQDRSQSYRQSLIRKRPILCFCKMMKLLDN